MMSIKEQQNAKLVTLDLDYRCATNRVTPELKDSNYSAYVVAGWEAQAAWNKFIKYSNSIR